MWQPAAACMPASHNHTRQCNAGGRCRTALTLWSRGHASCVRCLDVLLNRAVFCKITCCACLCLCAFGCHADGAGQLAAVGHAAGYGRGRRRAEHLRLSMPDVSHPFFPLTPSPLTMPICCPACRVHPIPLQVRMKRLHWQQQQQQRHPTLLHPSLPRHKPRASCQTPPMTT